MHKYSSKFALNIFLNKFEAIVDINEPNNVSDDILSEQDLPDEEGSSVDVT